MGAQGLVVTDVLAVGDHDARPDDGAADMGASPDPTAVEQDRILDLGSRLDDAARAELRGRAAVDEEAAVTLPTLAESATQPLSRFGDEHACLLVLFLAGRASGVGSVVVEGA